MSYYDFRGFWALNAVYIIDGMPPSELWLMNPGLSQLAQAPLVTLRIRRFEMGKQ
jgi:hypothetical protein